MDPPDVVALKRVVDKKIYLASPLFGEEFFASCMAFQNLCFETYTGWGRDALLKTTFHRRQEGRPNDWNTEWETCFSEKFVEPATVRAAYHRVMETFATNVGVNAVFIVPSSGEPPINHL